MTSISNLYRHMVALHHFNENDRVKARQFIAEIAKARDAMACMPIETLQDAAMFAYAATWGGSEAPSDSFSNRMADIIRADGSPLIFKKADGSPLIVKKTRWVA